MAQIGIQTYEAYNTIDDCKRPGSLTVPPASIRRLQKAGEPNGNTVKPTNLQNGSLLFNGGHGGRDHLPPAHQPQVIQPPGRRRILQPPGRRQRRRQIHATPQKTGCQRPQDQHLPGRRKAHGVGNNIFNFQDPPGRGHLALESSGGHLNPKFNPESGVKKSKRTVNRYPLTVDTLAH
jgi:hypothetical protein